MPSLQSFAARDPSDVTIHIHGTIGSSRLWDGWRVYGQQVSKSGQRLRIDCSEWLAEFDLARGSVTASLSADRGLALDSLLKTVMQVVVLNDRSALVMHASAVERGGEPLCSVGDRGPARRRLPFSHVRPARGCWPRR